MEQGADDSGTALPPPRLGLQRALHRSPTFHPAKTWVGREEPQVREFSPRAVCEGEG